MYVHNFQHSHVGYWIFLFEVETVSNEEFIKLFKFISDNSIVIQRQFHFRLTC